MAEHVLVTGGAGFVGSHLVDGLVNEGYRVRVLDNLDPQVHGVDAVPPPYLNSAAEFVRGSVTDAQLVRDALDDIDVVFHQAAAVGVGQSMYEIVSYCQANTIGAAVVLEEIVKRRDRVRKMIVASSMSIYGEGAYQDHSGQPRQVKARVRTALERGEWEVVDSDTGMPLRPVGTYEDKPLLPTSVYAVTKRDHEELFLSVGTAYHIPTVALRYFNIYGPRQSLSNPYTGVAAIFSSRLLNDRAPVIFEDGQQSRDFVHVSDVVRANLLALESAAADFHVLNVGTGRPTTVLQVAEALQHHLGRPELTPSITGDFREGDIRHCYADISKAKQLLEYEPTVGFEDGVKDLVDWVRDKVAVDQFERAHQELVAKGLA